MDIWQYITLFVQEANSILWGYLLIFALCFLGLYFTVRLKFIQIRYFAEGFRLFFRGFSLKGEKAGRSGMSSFQAVTTAVSGQVGTGNLAGPATAIMLGGPGAIFWIWISTFLGMATIYAEAILAQQFRTHDKLGQIVGGPAYYIEKGLKCRWLAVIFAVLCIVALGLIGNMVQANSIASAFKGAFGLPVWVSGIFIATVAGIVIIGGIRFIASFSEKVVPVMALCYLIGATIILVINAGYISPALKMIVVAAFNPEAVLGGGAGIAIQHAMRFGIARGLFANEAGMGSTPHAHAVAKVERPEHQGLLAMIGVFVVGFIITLTALVIITSGLKMLGSAGLPDSAILTIFKGSSIEITQQAYQVAFGNAGSVFVSISLFFFAFTTIIGWYYYAEMNIRYLFNSLLPLRIYQVCVITALFGAVLIEANFVWALADLFNGLMVLPNVIALLLLSPIVIRCFKSMG